MRMPSGCTAIPAPTGCQVGLHSTSSVAKPCWFRAAASVSPAIPPPTIKIRSTSAISVLSPSQQLHRMIEENPLDPFVLSQTKPTQIPLLGRRS